MFFFLSSIAKAPSEQAFPARHLNTPCQSAHRLPRGLARLKRRDRLRRKCGSLLNLRLHTPSFSGCGWRPRHFMAICRPRCRRQIHVCMDRRSGRFYSFHSVLISNRENQVVDFRTGYGFGAVTVQLYNSQDILVFEETVSLDGAPDPDIRVTPNAVGQWIRFIFTGSEALDCGGFGELKIEAVR